MSLIFTCGSNDLYLIFTDHPDDVDLLPQVAHQQLELYRQGFVSEESVRCFLKLSTSLN